MHQEVFAGLPEEGLYVVYTVFNRVTGRVYVGSTKEFESRWFVHLYSLRSKRHYNRALQDDWNRYGESAFGMEVLASCGPEFALAVEQYFLDELCAHLPSHGYNACRFAGGGIKFVPRRKYRLSAAIFKRPAPPRVKRRFWRDFSVII